MSLLNDVLKDLDDRKNQDPDVALIQQSSIGAQFASNQDRKRKLIGASLVGGVLLLIGLAVFTMTGRKPSVPEVATPFAESIPGQEAAPAVIAPEPVQAVSEPKSGDVPSVARAAPAPSATQPVNRQPARVAAVKPEAAAPATKVAAALPRFAAGEPSLKVNAASERVTVAPVAMATRIEPAPKVVAPASQPVVATAVSRPAPKPAPKPSSSYSANTAPSGQSSQPATSWSNPQRTSSYTRSAPVSERARTVTRPRSSSSPRGIQRLYELDLAARAEAEKLIKLGETQQAELILRQFLTQQPQAQLSRGALAGLMLQMNRAEEAEQVLMGGVAQQPEGRATIKLLARAHMGRDDAEGALRLLDANSVPISEDPEYHSLRAALYQRTARHESATRTYRSLLAEYPPQPAWWVGLAISLESQGQRREAIAAYRQARDFHGGKPALKAFANERIASLIR